MTAKKTKTVRVRATVSFHDIRRGDESTIALDPIVQGWINAGLLEVIDGGKDSARQGSAKPDDSGGVAARAGNGSAASAEQGQGFGAGGYGAAEGVDQD